VTQQYDPDNVFAKILRKELPAHIVDENQHTLTFMDLMPLREGHALVIPKEPAVNLFDLSTESLNHVNRQCQRVAKAVIKAFQSEGVMIVQLNNAGAGQSVFHYHMHVIPVSGGLPSSFHGRGMADPAELAANAEKLKAALQTLE